MHSPPLTGVRQVPLLEGGVPINYREFFPRRFVSSPLFISLFNCFSISVWIVDTYTVVSDPTARRSLCGSVGSALPSEAPSVGSCCTFSR